MEPFGTPFGPENFPPQADTSNEETGKNDLYPESIQDDVNESYTHDKVLPRIEGKDYSNDKDADNGY